MTNEHNFKVGDKVRNTHNGELGRITSATNDTDGDVDGCDVLFDDGIEEWMSVYEIELVEDTPCDRKTAFLRELQALLRKHDAHMEPCGCEIEGLSIMLKDNEEIYYKMDDFSPMRNLTADNIMDFNKD